MRDIESDFFTRNAISYIQSLDLYDDRDLKSVFDYFFNLKRYHVFKSLITDFNSTKVDVFSYVSRAFLDLFDIDCFKRPFHGEAKIALVYPNQCLERFDYSIFEYIVYENDYYFIMGYTSKDIFHIASIFRKQNTKSLILGFKYLKQLFIRILSEYSCLTGKVYLEPRDFTGSENDWRYAPSGGGSSTRLQNFYAAFGAEQTSRQNEYTLTLEKLENSMLGRSRLLQSL